MARCGVCGPIVRDVEEDIKHIRGEIETLQKIRKYSTTKEEVLPAFEAVRKTFSKVYRSLLFTYYHGDTKYDDICYFDRLGGIDLLVKYHEEIYLITRNTFFEEIHKYFVASTMEPCIGYFKCAKDNTLRKRLVDAGALDNSIEVFLEASISFSSDDLGRLFHSMRTICRISPLPEVHSYISKKGDVLDKILVLMETPKYFSAEEMPLSLRLLLTIAQTRECHDDLFKPEIVERLIASMEYRSQYKSEDVWLAGNVTKSVPILYCYFGCFMAEMVLGSAHLLQHFSNSTRTKLVVLMKMLLKYKVEEIVEYEHGYRMQGGSYLCIAYLFEPLYEELSNGGSICASTNAATPDNAELRQIFQLSIDVLLFFLQFSIRTEERVDILKDENMLEYLVMLPWSVPAISKERATHVVSHLAKFHQVQPPSLKSICMAKLANHVKGGLTKLLALKTMSQIVPLLHEA